MRATNEPVFFNSVVATGNTLSRDIKATSIDMKSTSSPNCSAVTARIFCFSILITRSSWRSFQASWLYPTSIANTLDAPFCNAQSVNPPVLAPISTITAPVRSIGYI